MASELARTRILVEASLPLGVECAPENFADDARVKDFVDGLCRGHPDLNMEIWVHWSGAPDVFVLRDQNRYILLRSKRFDVLLIEYFNLVRIASAPGFSGDRESLVASAVAKWFTEFLLGMRAPRLALRSLTRHQETDHAFVHHTFRDEALASLPDVEKAALQSYSIAHEIAHIVYPPHKNETLDFVYDGIDLRTHLTWELRQRGMERTVIDVMMAEMDKQLDANLLLTEIDADVSALGTVAVYLSQSFGVPHKHAFRSALFALQAQSFLNHCKHSCRLLIRHLRNGIDPHEFRMLNRAESQYIAARTRVALRRAGILWYLWEKEDENADEPDRFRAAVDDSLAEMQPLLLLFANAAFSETEQLFKEAGSLRSNQASDLELGIDLANFMSDRNSRLAIFKILIAMGYRGLTIHGLEGQMRNLDRLGVQNF